MPSVTSNSPEMLISCDCRHRLGLVLAGAVSPSLMNPYLFGSQIMLPFGPLIGSAGSGAMKPLCASSNEVLSVNGNSLSNASLAALVASVAGLGDSAAQAWLLMAMAAASTTEVLSFQIPVDALSALRDEARTIAFM
ncbi:hypothetical protein D3C77_415450 [compost metagenome]